MGAIQHQNIGNVIFCGVFHNVALEKAQINDVNFGKVFRRELRKGIAVGILMRRSLPLWPLPSMTVSAWLEFRNTAYGSLPDRYFRS